MPEAADAPGARVTDALSRHQIEALIYGSPSTPRFTQDSPVLPDVWIRYAEVPGEPHELLLTPFQDAQVGTVTAGQLSRALKACLALPQARRPPGPPVPHRGRRASVAYNQSTVLARLWFDELVRVVLPLSAWWHRLGETGVDSGTPPDERASVRRQRRRELLETLRTPEGQAALAVAVRNPAVAPSQLPPDLIWMVNVIGSLALVRDHVRAPGAPPALWWPLDDEAVQKLAPAEAERHEEALARHYRAVVERVIGLTEGLEDAPWGSAATLSPAGQDQPMVWSVSLNREARATMWRSRATVKADAAARVFDITCRELAWAVIDSGVDARHIAFRRRKGEGERYEPFENGRNRTRIVASYDFSIVRHLLSEETLDDALAELPAGRNEQEIVQRRSDVGALQRRLERGSEVDWDIVGRLIRIPHVEAPGREGYRPPKQQHGTHVAGILAGDCRGSERDGSSAAMPMGICPDLQLYDLRVLDDRGEGDEFNVMAALQFVRHLNSNHDVMVVHGVNLSLSIRHDIANFACGRTPVCEECERLVGSGIVVVTAAGNDGYLQYLTPRGPQDSYRSISITDPGNAAGVITVGSTHRFQPHTSGVSYFSSRGPTGDGRAKPDLVAPGEKIEAPVGGGQDVKRMDGTSMAAPHVSGAAALLIARHRELAGQPARVKQVLCATATDLGRERYFQGAGLVDTLRALQSV
ncbi:MAG TPA: S8 family peptidase [Candidatus Binatia bacterium]|nr:S8 family peptidase [Candidatus Binatia bacterium]